MSYLIYCPACCRKLNVPDHLAGKTVNCPGCSRPVFVGHARPGSQLFEEPETSSRATGDEDEEGPGLLVRWCQSLAENLRTVFMVCLLLFFSGYSLYRLFRTEPVEGADQYDYSTPKAALISRIKLNQDRDGRVLSDLDSLAEARVVQEKLRTLQIRREEEWRGIRLLFVSYEENGARKHSVQGFVKDPESGGWNYRKVDRAEARKDKSDLAKRMEAWEKAGELQ